MNIVKEAVRKLLPRSATRHTVLAGPLRGVSMVTSWHDYPGALLGRTERPLLEWFSRNVAQGETWLDIGAHYGYTAIAMSCLIGPRGRVIAFEPVLSSAACLQQTRNMNRLKQLTVVPLALSSNKSLQPVELPIVRGMADSTISNVDSTQTIYTVSLDSIWPSLCGGAPTVHGVKIDVQGMEEEVIAGMLKLLTLYKPKLVIEFHHGVNRSSIKELLRQCGYNAAGNPIDSLLMDCDGCYGDDKSYYFAPPEVNGRRYLERTCERNFQKF